MLVVSPLLTSTHDLADRANSANSPAAASLSAQARLVFSPHDPGVRVELSDKSADNSRFVQISQGQVRLFPLKDFDVFKPGEAISEFPLQLEQGERAKLIKLLPDNRAILVGVGRHRTVTSTDIYGELEGRISEGGGLDLYSLQGDLLARTRSYHPHQAQDTSVLDFRRIEQLDISPDAKLLAFINAENAVQVMELAPNPCRVDGGTALQFINKTKIMPEPAERDRNGICQVRFDPQSGALYFSTVRRELYCLERES